MSEDHELAWILKVEEMEEIEVDGFIRFLEEKGGKPSTVYGFENRTSWMLEPEIRDELTRYCFRLEVRSRKNSSAGSSPRPSFLSSDDGGDDGRIKSWNTVSRSRSRTSKVSHSINNSDIIELSDSSSGEFATVIKPHYPKLARPAAPGTRISQTVNRKANKRRFISSDEESIKASVKKQRRTASPYLAPDSEEEEEVETAVMKKGGKTKGVSRGKGPGRGKGEGNGAKGHQKKGVVAAKAKGKGKANGKGKATYVASEDGSGSSEASDEYGDVRSTGGRTSITRQLKVDHLVNLDHAPVYYQDAPDETQQAFLVDMTQGNGGVADPTASMDQVLRNKDMDSWGHGPKGTTFGLANPAKGTKIGLLSKDRKCRQRRLACQGADFCEHFDFEGAGLGDEYRREVTGETGWEEWAAIQRKERERRGATERTELYFTAQFWRILQDPCGYKDCTGDPVIRNRKHAGQGTNWFVGCTQWDPRDPERHAHRHRFPSSDVNADLLRAMLAGETIPEAVGLYESCFNGQSVRSQKRYCDEVHFRDGRPVVPRMTRRECPVFRVTYEPHSKEGEDPLRKILVIFENQHNHPPFAHHKLTYEAKKAVHEAYKASGDGGITAVRLMNAPTTKALNDGELLTSLHPGLHNKRLVRDVTAAAKKLAYPHGTGWPGVMEAYQQDQSMDPEKRYFWALLSRNDLHVLVTMVPSLAALIHTADEVVCDFTFKRVLGDINEWEVAIFPRTWQQRITAARVYSNASNTNDFEFLICAFHDALKNATGKPMRLRMIHGEGPIAYVFDAEAAQALGLAKAVRALPGFNPAQFGDDNDVLAHVLLLCRVHFMRNLMKLKEKAGSKVTGEDIETIQSILYCQTGEEVERWKQFCSSHPDKSVQNYYGNKQMYEGWLLPALNPYCSKIRRELFLTARKETNITESQHARTNKETSIRLPLLIAIERARKFDEQEATALHERNTLGVQMNRQNSDLHRLRQQQQRTSSKTLRGIVRQELEAEKNANDNEIDELQQRLAEAKQKRKQIQENIKKPPPMVYGRSQPPLRPQNYVAPPSQSSVEQVYSVHGTFQPQYLGQPMAHNGNCVIPDEVLRTHLPPPPPIERDNGAALGMFVAPPDYLPGPQSHFQEEFPFDARYCGSQYDTH